MASSAQPGRIQNILTAPKNHREKKSYLSIMAGAVIVTVIGSIAYVQMALSRPELRTENNSTTRAVYPDPSTVGLSGTRTGRDIHITWNPQSSTFSDVRIGMLTIKDGESQREIALTAAELQARKIIYSPTTDRVEASLELFSPDRKSTRESVLFVLDPRGSTAPPVLELRTIVPVQQDASNLPDTQMRSRTDEVGITTVRAFTAPVAQRSATEAQVTMTDAPPVVQSTETGSLPLMAIQLLPSPPRSPESPSSKQAIPPQPNAQPRPRKPTRQVLAEVPPNVIAMLRDPVQVEVRALVDSSGRVVHAESLASASVLNRYLGTAAVDAAKMWRFERGDAAAVVLRFTFDPR